MVKGTYDVVIAGTDLPAVIFGALAAKKGYRVLVLGHGSDKNVYEVNGYLFVRRSCSLFGLSDSAPIRNVFKELALSSEINNLLQHVSPACQVILPDARVDVSLQREVFTREIEREFPGQFKTLESIFGEFEDVERLLEPVLATAPVLPPGSIREWFAYRNSNKALSSLLSKTGTDALEPLSAYPRLRSFLAGPTSAMSRLAEPWKAPIPFVRLISHMRSGPVFVEWGEDTLKKLFLARINDNSGDVRGADSVDTLVVKRGRVQEVEILNRAESIGVGMMVCGDDLHSFLPLIPQRQAKRRYHAKIEAKTPSHYGITLNLGMRRSGLPEGLAHMAHIISDPTKPMHGSNLLTIRIDPAMPPIEGQDPSKVTLSVTALMPANRFNGQAAPIQEFADEMLVQLKRLLPFLDEHLEVADVSSIKLDEKTGLPVLERTGLIEIYPEIENRSIDLMTWPVRTAYKNMLNLANYTAGPLGFEGAFVAAQVAFSILSRQFELKRVM